MVLCEPRTTVGSRAPRPLPHKILYPEQCWAARSLRAHPACGLVANREPFGCPGACACVGELWEGGVPVAVCEPHREPASVWVWALKPDLPLVSQALPTAGSDLQ